MRRLGTATACWLVFAVAGCGDDAVPPSFADWAALREANVEVICDCHDVFGWDSEQMCENKQDLVLPSGLECASRAIRDDPEASAILRSCYMPLESDFSTCVDERLDCSDGESVAPCIEDYEVGLRDCEELPPAVERDLEDCKVALDAPVRCSNACEHADDDECDDGGRDSDTAVCDLGTDCSDCGLR